MRAFINFFAVRPSLIIFRCGSPLPSRGSTVCLRTLCIGRSAQKDFLSSYSRYVLSHSPTTGPVGVGVPPSPIATEHRDKTAFS